MMAKMLYTASCAGTTPIMEDNPSAVKTYEAHLIKMEYQEHEVPSRATSDGLRRDTIIDLEVSQGFHDLCRIHCPVLWLLELQKLQYNG